MVVGSGAGGGLIAAEPGRHGHDVLLLEACGLYPASTHIRFELEARNRLWWPARHTEGDEPVALLAGRRVGGSTVINTKVAMRAAPLTSPPSTSDPACSGRAAIPSRPRTWRPGRPRSSGSSAFASAPTGRRPPTACGTG